MDHYELVAELPIIERLTPAERIQLAKQRRALQLLRWNEKYDSYDSFKDNSSRKANIKFQPNITLLEATSRNDVEEVRQLLNDGIDPNVSNEDGLTALHQCAIDNNEQMLLTLIDYGANVNSRDTELWTPLHAAGCCGHLKIVRHLVEHGAELLAVNADGNMPYDICDDEETLDYIESEMAKRGVTQEDIDEERLIYEKKMLQDVQYLFKNGKNFEFKDEKGATPLHVASAKGYYTVVKYLLEVGASVHVRDNDGWQPVHAAACWAQPDSIELLVSYGADINARTPAGETPFDLCEDESVRAVIMTLQLEQRRRLLSFARDSRRMSKRRKPSSKFESPNQGNNESHRLSASRGAIRRHSLRDRAGVTLARLEARREAALLRSYSFDGSTMIPLLQMNASPGEDSVHDEKMSPGMPMASSSSKNDELNSSNVVDLSKNDSSANKNVDVKPVDESKIMANGDEKIDGENINVFQNNWSKRTRKLSKTRAKPKPADDRELLKTKNNNHENSSGDASPGADESSGNGPLTLADLKLLRSEERGSGVNGNKTNDDTKDASIKENDNSIKLNGTTNDNNDRRNSLQHRCTSRRNSKFDRLKCCRIV
uniref:Protein phosphatase 1 regulatory subunit 16A n=1 Tax=Romanomermis culicivorax TaxID=13658 RepID=A0A915JY74_ROMCU